MENVPAERFRVSDRAPAAMGAAGSGPARTFVDSQPVQGRGGSGHRLAHREPRLHGGETSGGAGELRINLDHHSRRRLAAAALDYDLEKETEGFWPDQTDAALAAFD